MLAHPGVPWAWDAGTPPGYVAVEGCPEQTLAGWLAPPLLLLTEGPGGQGCGSNCLLPGGRGRGLGWGPGWPAWRIHPPVGSQVPWAGESGGDCGLGGLGGPPAD